MTSSSSVFDDDDPVGGRDLMTGPPDSVLIREWLGAWPGVWFAGVGVGRRGVANFDVDAQSE